MTGIILTLLGAGRIAFNLDYLVVAGGGGGGYGRGVVAVQAVLEQVQVFL